VARWGQTKHIWEALATSYILQTHKIRYIWAFTKIVDAKKHFICEFWSRVDAIRGSLRVGTLRNLETHGWTRGQAKVG
jgi:hypothetical protein